MAKDNKDKYDKAIEYLEHAPKRELLNAWSYPLEHPAGCLFNYAGPQGTCGCLTMVREQTGIAATHELTKAIRADERIPASPHRITLDDLPVFAEWQRRLDRKLGKNRRGRKGG